MIDLDELEGLVAQMTPGPWVVDAANHDLIARDGKVYDYVCEVAPAEFSTSCNSPAQDAANAAGIAALRNSAEELIRDARRWREHEASLMRATRIEETK